MRKKTTFDRAIDKATQKATEESQAEIAAEMDRGFSSPNASVTPELADAAARLRNAGWIWSDDPTVEDIIGEAINCCMDRDEQEPDYEDFERRRDAAVARATKHLASLSTDRIAEGLSPDAARLLETMLKSWETMGWSDHWDKLVAEIRQWIARRPPLPPPPVADIEGKE